MAATLRVTRINFVLKAKAKAAYPTAADLLAAILFPTSSSSDDGVGALLRQALPRQLLRPLALILLVRLAHLLVLLGQHHLNVARARHVRVGATVGTVGAAALLLRPVDLDVEQLEVVDVEALHLRLETMALSGESSAEVTGLRGHSASGMPTLHPAQPANCTGRRCHRFLLGGTSVGAASHLKQLR